MEKFNIISDKKFIYNKKKYDFKNVKHFFSENTVGDNYDDKYFYFEIIMNDGFKISEMVAEVNTNHIFKYA